jgi:hypothetical protein
VTVIARVHAVKDDLSHGLLPVLAFAAGLDTSPRRQRCSASSRANTTSDAAPHGVMGAGMAGACQAHDGFVDPDNPNLIRMRIIGQRRTDSRTRSRKHDRHRSNEHAIASRDGIFRFRDHWLPDSFG